jgi:hypothetical protein
MRRRLPWVFAMPLMAAGALGAHAAAAWLATTRPPEAGREVAERASAGVAADSVVVIGLVLALLLGGASVIVDRRRRRSARGVSVGVFFWLPPLAFALQEVAERLLRAEAAPFSAVSEPRFLLGLAFQVPFGLAALLLAQMCLRVATRLVGALVPRPRLPLRRPPSLVLPFVGCVPPRIPALALGYPQRGPPA